MRRLSTVEENPATSLVAIKCLRVPQHVTKDELRDHFSQFGTVTRVFTYPDKQTATVHFSDHVRLLIVHRLQLNAITIHDVYKFVQVNVWFVL